MHFTIAGDYVRATGALQHPAAGRWSPTSDRAPAFDRRRATRRSTCRASPSGPNLQPDELTRLTEGVIALVNGTISGQGRITGRRAGRSLRPATSRPRTSISRRRSARSPAWPATSTSPTCSALTTPPGQVLTVQSINPGILVENGVIRYQLLPHQLVKIERGEWPFMGGRLILRRDRSQLRQPERQAADLRGRRARRQDLRRQPRLQGARGTGTFDGVLPMIFDENGGRIVGGRLDSARPGGGSLAYNGVVNKAEPGHDGRLRLRRCCATSASSR